jgi:hypothetical protein
MKDTTAGHWPRGLRWLGGWLARLRGRAPATTPVALPDDADWLSGSAVGEEDPGASVDLLDTRPPDVKGAPPR